MVLLENGTREVIFVFVIAGTLLALLERFASFNLFNGLLLFFLLGCALLAAGGKASSGSSSSTRFGDYG